MRKVVIFAAALLLVSTIAFIAGSSMTAEIQVAGYAVRGAAPVDAPKGPEFPFSSLAAHYSEIQSDGYRNVELAGYAVRGAAPVDSPKGPEFPFSATAALDSEIQVAGYAVRGAAPADSPYGPEFPF